MMPEFEVLKEKVAACTDLTPDERTLILDALNMGNYKSVRRQYPSHHGPGSSRWATAAWAVLDQMRPDALAVRDRFLLGGLIAGALSEMYELGRRGK